MKPSASSAARTFRPVRRTRMPPPRRLPPPASSSIRKPSTRMPSNRRPPRKRSRAEFRVGRTPQARPVQAGLETPPERDGIRLNRHRALGFCLSMISAQTRRVCREGKPLHTFPDHALAARLPGRGASVSQFRKHIFSEKLDGPDRVRRQTDREHQPLGARVLGGQRLLEALFRRATNRQTFGKIVEQAELAHQSDVRVARPGAVAPAQFEKRLAKMFWHPGRFKVFVANDVSSQERQHGPDLVARDVSVHGTIQSRYLPYLEIFRGPARF